MVSSRAIETEGGTPVVSFRYRLRQATRPSHEAVDALFSRLDLTTRAGLGRFLRVHLACFTSLAVSAEPPGLRRAVSALHSDLAALGCEPVRDTKIRSFAPVDPLVVDYIYTGSRLGTRVLRNRWADSRDPQVRAACSYFDTADAAPDWRRVCAELADVDMYSPRAGRIVADTIRTFDMFACAYHEFA